MRIVIKFIFLLCITWISSCASIARNSFTEPLDIPDLKISKKVEIQYYVYRKQEDSQFLSLVVDPVPEIESIILERLSKNNLIQPKNYNTLSRAIFSGDMAKQNAEKYTKPKFPISSEYLIVFEVLNYQNYTEFIPSLNLIHFITAGLIPIRLTNSIEIKMSLYDRNGKVLNEKVINDAVVIWSWSPLALVNGFKFFEKKADLSKPAVENSVSHLMTGLSF